MQKNGMGLPVLPIFELTPWHFVVTKLHQFAPALSAAVCVLGPLAPSTGAVAFPANISAPLPRQKKR
jgi:hypothetical protein